jgi:hypothetical protein
MADFGSKEITPDIAGQVLWHFDQPRGRKPGSFAQALLAAVCAADPENRARLALGFPGYVVAVQLAQGQPEGMGELHRIAVQGKATT